MDRYSRSVAILKVLLPLAALALLSTMFLLSRGADIDATIPFADTEIEERLRGQQVTEPVFSGVTPNGDEITFSAGIAGPPSADKPAYAKDLNARIKTVDGVDIRLRADAGNVDVQTDLATFTGNVIIETTSGFRMETDDLTASLTGISADAPGQVRGTGPMGRFTAGGMEMRAQKSGGPVHTLFKGGVKLIYDPNQSER